MATKYNPEVARAKGQQQYDLVTAGSLNLNKLLEPLPDKATKLKDEALDKKVKASVVKLNKREASLKNKLSKLTDTTEEKLQKREKEIDAILARQASAPMDIDESPMMPHSSLDLMLEEFKLALDSKDYKRASASSELIASSIATAPNTAKTRKAYKKYASMKHLLMQLQMTTMLHRGVKAFGAWGKSLVPKSVKKGLANTKESIAQSLYSVKTSLPFKAGAYVVDRIKGAAGAMGALGRAYKDKRGETKGVLGWLNKKLDSMQGLVKSMYRKATGSVGGMMDSLAIGYLVSQMLGPFIDTIDKFFTDNFGEHYIRDFFASALSSAWDFVKNGIIGLAKEAAGVIKTYLSSELSINSGSNYTANLAKYNSMAAGAEKDAFKANVLDPSHVKEVEYATTQANAAGGNDPSNEWALPSPVSKATVTAAPAGASTAPMESGAVVATPPSPTPSGGGPVSEQGGTPAGGGLGIGMVPSHSAPDNLLLYGTGLYGP